MHFLLTTAVEVERGGKQCAWIWETPKAVPSISSKKIIAGSRFCASANNSRSCRSDSPTHFESTSAPLRMKKATSAPAREHDAAKARAIKVLRPIKESVSLS